MEPQHRSNVQQLILLLQESLAAAPFHIQAALPSMGGTHSLLGLRVGLSWEKNKEFSIAPFVAQAVPAAADRGIDLFEFVQGRIHFSCPGGNGLERLTFAIWHRHANDKDTSLRGPWIRGQTITNLRAIEECLDPLLWHREIFIQCTGFAAGGSLATTAVVWVAGAEALSVGAQVTVSGVTVDIDAFGAAPDSVLAVGSEDGTIAGVRHVLKTTATSELEAQLVLPVGGSPPSPAVGVLARMPEAKIHIYAAGPPALTLTFTPTSPNVVVVMVPGVALGLVVAGQQITATVVAGTTTYAALKVAWDADAVVLALSLLTGDAGTFPVGYAGGTINLWTERTILVVEVCGQSPTSGVVPLLLTPDGQLQIAATVADVVTVKQPTAADLNCTEASAAATLARLDVVLSTRASEATVATLATQATLATRASEVTVATLATQATAASILVDTTAINGKTPALGQGLMAASVPVVVASNQSSLPVTEASAAGILAKLDVALSTRATEVTVATLATQATLATRASEATVATLATQATLATRASEATVATLATQATVATLATQATVATLALEATQGAVKTAVEKIDNPVIAQDGIASDAMTAGAELADIAALPADGVAGRIRRVLASLKGILFTYKAYLDWGEDASRNVMRVEQQPSASAEVGADAIIVAAGTAGRVYALVYSVTVAAQVILRADAVVGGAIIKTFDLPIGCDSIDLHGLPYGNGLFFDHVSGTELCVVLYRNT